MGQDAVQPEKSKILARELKENILKEKGEVFRVIAFTDDGKSWWHVHNDEIVPEKWGLMPFPEYNGT